jgi:tRNA (guanosine-2'-O-)-methyltransferase
MTPARYQKIRSVLAQRQLDLTLCLEQVHKPQNLAAIIRTCDAVGIHQYHVVWDKKMRFRRGTSKGSHQWVYPNYHPDIEQAVGALREQKMQVLVTHLSDQAVDFRQIDYTQPTAIILGQEKYGATPQAVALTDQQIVVPMMGMVQSLNVSVAAALILYEAQKQRELSGQYKQQQLSEAICQRILFENSYSRLRHLCDQKNMPYPAIDDQGQIDASEQWWRKMQLTPSAYAALEAKNVEPT